MIRWIEFRKAVNSISNTTWFYCAYTSGLTTQGKYGTNEIAYNNGMYYYINQDLEGYMVRDVFATKDDLINHIKLINH